MKDQYKFSSRHGTQVLIAHCSQRKGKQSTSRMPYRLGKELPELCFGLKVGCPSQTHEWNIPRGLMC